MLYINNKMPAKSNKTQVSVPTQAPVVNMSQGCTLETLQNEWTANAKERALLVEKM